MSRINTYISIEPIYTICCDINYEKKSHIMQFFLDHFEVPPLHTRLSTLSWKCNQDLPYSQHFQQTPSKNIYDLTLI